LANSNHHPQVPEVAAKAVAVPKADVALKAPAVPKAWKKIILFTACIFSILVGLSRGYYCQTF
jgi:hypothetical protein